jgi:hypothetical protein
MTRRNLFARILSICTVSAVDPERLLWRPGRKLISIPKMLHVPADRQFKVNLQIEGNAFAAIERACGHDRQLVERRFFAQYIQPAVVSLTSNVKQEAGIRPVAFRALALPKSVDFARSYHLEGFLPTVRVLRWYDIVNDTWSVRADCLARI